MNSSCPTLAFFLTPMLQSISSMELKSVLRELMLTPRTSLHHSKSTAPINPADFIPNTVSLQDYQVHWKQSKECTSSSISGLHFGHWKAAAESDFLSELHALFTDIIISTGYSPIRWQQGLSVMLEKKKGVCITSKLHAILLREANFNFHNMLFFG